MPVGKIESPREELVLDARVIWTRGSVPMSGHGRVPVDDGAFHDGSTSVRDANVACQHNRRGRRTDNRAPYGPLAWPSTVRV
ncbi:MAG: hypothetical protein ACRDTK_18760, partial [Mycobacterium sp.]